MDLTFEPATQLAARLRRREIGVRELLDHYIARVERLDPRINAVVVRDFDRARARAATLDASSDRDAPLFGVPMTVKESFDVAGLPTTRGHVELRDRPAGGSSLAVRRLEAAGAVIFAKTNVPVDLADWQSYNPVYGTTSNPWNAAHTPGGSSGGSAAAMAAGLAGMELGTDIGGSVRVRRIIAACSATSRPGRCARCTAIRRPRPPPPPIFPCSDRSLGPPATWRWRWTCWPDPIRRKPA